MIKVTYTISTEVIPPGDISGAWKEFETDHYPTSKDFSVKIDIPPKDNDYALFTIDPDEEGLCTSLERGGTTEININLLPTAYVKSGEEWSEENYKQFHLDMLALCEHEGWHLIDTHRNPIEEERAERKKRFKLIKK